MQDIIRVATYEGKGSDENSVRIDIVKVAPPMRSIDGLFQELFGLIEKSRIGFHAAKLGIPQARSTPSAKRP